MVSFFAAVLASTPVTFGTVTSDDPQPVASSESPKRTPASSFDVPDIERKIGHPVPAL